MKFWSLEPSGIYRDLKSISNSTGALQEGLICLKLLIGCWKETIFKVLSNSNLSVFLWFLAMHNYFDSLSTTLRWPKLFRCYLGWAQTQTLSWAAFLFLHQPCCLEAASVQMPRDVSLVHCDVLTACLVTPVLVSWLTKDWAEWKHVTDNSLGSDILLLRQKTYIFCRQHVQRVRAPQDGLGWKGL